MIKEDPRMIDMQQTQKETKTYWNTFKKLWLRTVQDFIPIAAFPSEQRKAQGESMKPTLLLMISKAMTLYG